MKHLFDSLQLCDLTITESISNANFGRAYELINRYLEKYGIHTMKILDEVNIDGKWNYTSALAFNAIPNTGCLLIWKSDSSYTDLYAASFYDNAAELLFAQQEGLKCKSKCTLYTADLSYAKILPIIKGVLEGEIKMDKSALAKYLDSDIIEESEGVDALIKQRMRLQSKLYAAKKSGRDTSSIEQELDNVRQQISAARAGGSSIATFHKDKELDEVEAEFEERATPEQRFADMENYVKMVLKGIQPSLIVTGAPGVGKTYRITNLVKQSSAAKKGNYYIIKGKCTPGKLYQTLFDYHEPDDILIIDDADDIITDPLSINLLKAACDSSDERIVSYGTSKAPTADGNMVELHPDWEWDRKELNGKEYVFYPPSFTYEGRIIIITNMNAGQLDTALRNRSFICDLAFTTEEVLGIVHSLMPAIMPGKIESTSKIKAYDYLQELAQQGKNMEISIRSFTTVAKIYDCCGSDDSSAQRMIREQMKLQYARGGKRY